MRLVDLDPKLTGSSLRFTCPECRRHAIVVPLRGDAWTCSGTVETATVSPSIDANTAPACHWHGFVTNGEVLTIDGSHLEVDPVSGLVTP